MIPHFLPPFCHSFSMYQPPWPWALHCAPESPKNQTHMHPYTQELTQLSQEADIKRSDNCPYESYRGPVGVWPDLENQSSELEDIYSLVGGWAKHGWNSALGRGNIMITGQVVGGCRGRAGHILGSEGRLGWLECVCSTDPFVPVCSPCGCFSRVMVCSSLPQLGLLPVSRLPRLSVCAGVRSPLRRLQALPRVGLSRADFPGAECPQDPAVSRGTGVVPRSKGEPVWKEELQRVFPAHSSASARWLP